MTIRKPNKNRDFIFICLFFVYLIVNFYGSFRAMDTSDWVFETLEDHTNKPKNEVDFQWLTDRNGELNVWNPSDSGIDHARLDIELSLCALYYPRLSNRQIRRMRSNVGSYLNSNNKDTRTLGAELQKLLDYRSTKLWMSQPVKEKFKAEVANQIRADLRYLEDFK